MRMFAIGLYAAVSAGALVNPMVNGGNVVRARLGDGSWKLGRPLSNGSSSKTPTCHLQARPPPSFCSNRLRQLYLTAFG